MKLFLLNQSTESNAANSTSATPNQLDFKYSITTTLYEPCTFSARALSYESPVVPTEALNFAVSNQWV